MKPILLSIMLIGILIMKTQGAINNDKACYKHVNILLNADHLESSMITESALESDYAKSFRIINSNNNSQKLFEFIFNNSSNEAGKLYALLGMWLKDKNAYHRYRDRLNLNAKVESLMFSIREVKNVEEWINRIESGELKDSVFYGVQLSYEQESSMSSSEDINRFISNNRCLVIVESVNPLMAFNVEGYILTLNNLDGEKIDISVTNDSGMAIYKVISKEKDFQFNKNQRKRLNQLLKSSMNLFNEESPDHSDLNKLHKILNEKSDFVKLKYWHKRWQPTLDAPKELRDSGVALPEK